MENKMNIRFSPPDVGEAEIEEVIDAIKSGWITTGPKTKLFEQKITELCKTESWQNLYLLDVDKINSSNGNDIKSIRSWTW